MIWFQNCNEYLKSQNNCVCEQAFVLILMLDLILQREESVLFSYMHFYVLNRVITFDSSLGNKNNT